MKGKVSTIIPSIAPEADDIALDRLLAPARHFDHPVDVLRMTDLDVPEKRAILASWASDACAVESMPALRRPPGSKRAVTFDEVMDALQSLDSQARQGHPDIGSVTANQLEA
jgi:hypothetical protein